ncbi:hypothetical protein ACFQWF_20810 [Methylorubrum suomiense]
MTRLNGKAVVADDDPFFRIALTSILKDHLGISEVQQVGSSTRRWRRWARSRMSASPCSTSPCPAWRARPAYPPCGSASRRC